jgi:hypothetical protein
MFTFQILPQFMVYWARFLPIMEQWSLWPALRPSVVHSFKLPDDHICFKLQHHSGSNKYWWIWICTSFSYSWHKEYFHYTICSSFLEKKTVSFVPLFPSSIIRTRDLYKSFYLHSESLFYIYSSFPQKSVFKVRTLSTQTATFSSTSEKHTFFSHLQCLIFSHVDITEFVLSMKFYKWARR